MNRDQAKQTIDKYFKILRETEGKCIARDQATLPVSKDELRKAHFVYVEELIRTDSHLEKIQPLINSFNRIDTFIEKSKADELNYLWTKFKTKRANWFERHLRSYKKYVHHLETIFLGFKSTEEIMDFIHNTCKRFGRPSLIYQDTQKTLFGVSPTTDVEKLKEDIFKKALDPQDFAEQWRL